MYIIKCDDYILYDPRDDDLIVNNPKVNLEVNTVGEASFTIYKNHPYYDKLKKLKSVFEVSDDVGVIFRGRMTDDSCDFHNSKAVDMEGVMAYFNDSKVRPYKFPEDFLEDADYIVAASSGNVVAFFLGWLIQQHNSQVQGFQRFKLGKVTVSDPNNYITRSDSKYPNTWEVLKDKLFDSPLGGYLCIRYEANGNYIDYLSEFELTNTQEITFGENLLDLKTDSDASETYSAVIPIGAEVEDADGNKTALTIENIPDGDITSDIVKSGDTLYSRSAVEAYGWIYAPIDTTTWDDVTVAYNLVTRGAEYLASDGHLLTESVELTAVDLHLTDKQIQSFRIYRNVITNSKPHGHSGMYQLKKLGLDLQNPQNTKITVGNSQRTLTDINSKKESDSVQRIESVENDLKEYVADVRQTIEEKSTSAVNTAQAIILSALASYVETSNYEEFKQTMTAQLQIMADNILMNFETTSDRITNVDGDMQSAFTRLYKYIAFSGENGIVIGNGDNKITLSLDTAGIVFKRNGVPFGTWDGDNFYTGNIVVRVNERAQFGNFAFVPRSDGSLMFLKVQ